MASAGGVLRLVTFQPILQYTDNNRHTQGKSYLFLIYNSNMKHLKTFDSNNLEYDVKDIFLAEVDEDRFDIIVSSRPVKHHQHQVVVSLNEVSFEDDGHEGFRLGELKEFLLRLKTYLDSNNFTHTPLSIMIHDGMDSKDHIISHWSTRRYINSRSRSTISLTEKDIDEVDKWYNTIDAPGLLKVYISITH